MTPEAPQYLVARLHRALAEDPRTAEQGVRVHVGGSTVQLSGELAPTQRCDAPATVLADHVPAMTVRNDVQVVPTGRPAEREKLR